MPSNCFVFQLLSELVLFTATFVNVEVPGPSFGGGASFGESEVGGGVLGGAQPVVFTVADGVWLVQQVSHTHLLPLQYLVSPPPPFRA